MYKIYGTSRSYWISSPPAANANLVMYVDCYGYVNYLGYLAGTSYNNNNIGFRPIVCLKSGISLKEVEEGKSYQI